MQQSLLELSLHELTQWAVNNDLPPFRAKQIFEWVWKRGILETDKMTNLPKQLREKLNTALMVSPLTLVKVEASDDGETFKFLWRLRDEKLIESVLIVAPDRFTVCVSSQVGCPARCAFCASGKKGLIRNLTSSEIIAQVLHIQAYLLAQEKQITNIVYMGMGEPLKNYESVVASIRALIDPDKFGLSQRRITVSTVGIVEGIQRFTQEGLKVQLVLSLHAPNQTVRQKIIPFARQYQVEDILDAMEQFHEVTGRDITYEYTLLEGINDEPEHAKELVKLLKKRQCTVNLIPYNPIPGLKLKRPSHERIQAFRAILTKGGINTTCRYTKGDDILAACGQLVLLEENSQQLVQFGKKTAATQPDAI